MAAEFDHDQFSRRLNQTIALRGLKRRKLSMKVGADKSAIREWTKCGSTPKPEKIFKLCTELEISADWLLGLSDDAELKGVPTKEFDRDQFSFRINDTLAQQKMKPKALAEKLDCCTASIQFWKSKKALPNGSSLFRICKAFDISADWLLGLSDNLKRRK